MSYIYYCPYCGNEYYINPHYQNCPNCFTKTEFIKSKKESNYYEQKSLTQFGNYMHTSEILINEEVSKNPLFDSEKSKLKNVKNKQTEIFLNKISNKSNINIPKCPTCQSANIKSISGMKRAVHGYAFGLFSKTARSQFECKDCGYKW